MWYFWLPPFVCPQAIRHKLSHLQFYSVVLLPLLPEGIKIGYTHLVMRVAELAQFLGAAWAAGVRQ